MTFYNEIDPFAANWLENLAAHDQIAPGIVNRRSIADLTPADVAGHAQCHFFAGIGGWSLALRRAGISDDANVWTGSCPCQPFSDAGQGRGLSDARHLWPAWFSLIEQCRPPVIFGEQVASSDGIAWLDLVHADLERCGYAVGAADLCAAGVGAPHQRQRLYFVAYASGQQGRLQLRPRGPRIADAQAGRSGEDGSVADAHGSRQRPDESPPPPRTGEPVHARRGARRGVANPGSAGSQDGRDGRAAVYRRADVGVVHTDREQRQRVQRVRRQARDRAQLGGQDGVLEHPGGERSGRDAGAVHGPQGESQSQGERQGRGPRLVADVAVDAGATRGFWADADWILCRDPSGGAPVARPVEPGTFPLATGVPGRVGLIRGYGNAINIEVAVQFILASLEAISS